jgi:protein-arginine kinase activator protein McsA
MSKYKCVFCKEVGVQFGNCLCSFCSVAGVAMVEQAPQKDCVSCGNSFKTTNNSPRCRDCYVVQHEQGLPLDRSHVTPVTSVNMADIREMYPFIPERDDRAGRTVCGACDTSWPDREKHDECPNCGSDWSEFYLG